MFALRTVAIAILLAPFLLDPVVAEEVVYFGFDELDLVSGATRTNRWMQVNEGLIIALGSGPDYPRSGRIVDMRGRFAMPGLIDTHAHLTLGPLEFTKLRGEMKMVVRSPEDLVRRQARTALAFGITTVRNPGGSTVANQNYALKIQSNEWAGPEALQAGLILNPSVIEGLTVWPPKELDMKQEIHRQKAAGMAWIKFYEGLSAEQLRSGIALAHEAGLQTVAHLGKVSWTEAARMEIDALVHLMPISPSLLTPDALSAYQATARPGAFAFFEWWEHADLDSEPIKEMIAELVRHEVWIDATLIAFHNAFWGDSKAVTEGPDLAFAHPAMLENWRGFMRFDLGWKADDYQRAKAIWPKMQLLLRDLHAAGVGLTIGSDAANPWTVPGPSMHQEMALFVAAGIPTLEVLRMATMTAADRLRIADRTGRLAPGLEADVIFLTEDPRADINNTRSIDLVLNNDRAIRPQ